MKKVALIFIVSFVVIFGVSFILGDKDEILVKFGGSIILALASTAMGISVFYGKSDKKSKTTTATNRKVPSTAVTKTIYVCKHLSNNVVYKVEGNKVYKHLSPKVVYEIKNEKVYRYLENKPLFIIKGNKLYKPNKNTDPAYRIEHNKVYEGLFSRTPIYDLRSEKDRYNQAK